MHILLHSFSQIYTKEPFYFISRTSIVMASVLDFSAASDLASDAAFASIKTCISLRTVNLFTRMPHSEVKCFTAIIGPFRLPDSHLLASAY